MESKISQGSEVELTLEKGRVVLYPVNPTEYRLEELLAAVTEDTLHEEVDAGQPVGREVW